MFRDLNAIRNGSFDDGEDFEAKSLFQITTVGSEMCC